MNSTQRVIQALGHSNPDRHPFFLLLTLHGARLLGMSPEKYFSRADFVADGQTRLNERFGHDCLYAFYHAALEGLAWGCPVEFRSDGPPVTTRPAAVGAGAIRSLECPSVRNDPGLSKALETISILKGRFGDSVPIVGVAISPFSLPVMQVGFEAYLDMIFEDRDLFWDLMDKNTAYTSEWAAAQLEAGATAICYFDPVASPSIIPRETYIETGWEVARKTLSLIPGPTATHMASGRALPILDDLVATKTAAVGVSCLEKLAELRARANGKIAIIGNLNGVEMCRWTPAEAAEITRRTLESAGPAGGFILSDNHGEIPFHVSFEVLDAIASAARSFIPGRNAGPNSAAPSDPGEAD